ncbi:MAG: imidazolonepropionase [Muribaculaceae bacterium]|nr:imidazolonepropionase [Muribaculaceae bacterium]
MLITNIKRLIGVDNERRSAPLRGAEMSRLGIVEDAWLRVENGKISGWGKMENIPSSGLDEIHDAKWGDVIPSFCDSHTHIVYAGSREGEFEDKIRGLSYEEIAKRGGGILNSADRLQLTTENELYRQSMERAREVMAMGTGCIEIKSGYGLTLQTELKMLRVIARIAESVPMRVRATFLGAHAVGRAYAGRQGEYVDMLIRDMLPAVAAEGLADFVDVFCDEGFFTPSETDRILENAAKHGMRPKIHANELAVSGGVQVGVAHNALSVDHLERAEEAEIALLSKSDTVATVLPGASFFLGMPYGPARKMIDRGVAVALASDYNPGSSPSGNMRMVMSLGCIKLKLTPEESLNAVTINGAVAMDCAVNYGSIAIGKVANFIITKPLPSFAFLPYAYATPFISSVWLKGKKVSDK